MSVLPAQESPVMVAWEDTGRKVGPRQRRVAAVRGVKIVEQVARNGRVIAVRHDAVVHGFERQADRSHPNGMTGRGDVLCVASVPFGQSSLHGGEIVVEAVQAVATAIAPRHEEHRFSAFVGNRFAQQNRGVLAVLPHAVG